MGLIRSVYELLVGPLVVSVDWSLLNFDLVALSPKRPRLLG